MDDRSGDRSATVAQGVRRRVTQSAARVWCVEDFDGSPAAVNSELRRLVARGELTRIRRGVYWRGKKGRFGMTRAPQAKALRKAVGEHEAVGATGWHATNLLGLSTQVSPVEMLAVTHRRPRGFDGVKVVTRTARTGRRDVRLNDLEVTYLEALEGWDRYVEVKGPVALRRFTELLDDDRIRVDRLVGASYTEPPAVRERLRAVLSRGGFDDAAAKVRGARDPRTRSRALHVLQAA
jgi:hypothetical protein